MPLYEYRCRKCGKTIEKIQKFSDAPLTKCEKCGGKLEKLLSSSAIQFKGTGWYITDYARKSSPPPSESGSSSSNGDSSKSETKSKAEKPKKPAPSSKK